MIEEDLRGIKRFHQQFICVTRCITNCLIDKEIHKTFEDPVYMPITSKIIEFLQFHHDWKTQKLNGVMSFTSLDKIERSKTYSLFF